MEYLNNDWDSILKEEFKKGYYIKLKEFLCREYKDNKVYPKRNDIYNAFKFTSYNNTKVLILGQDPYHQPLQANGLSFSVDDNIKLPPSLKNIFKELLDDLKIDHSNSGNLSNWAKQGVLLLNTTLTVRDSQPMSHKGRGWEELTESVINYLNEKKTPVVFILWGNLAKDKKKLITNSIHHVIESVHPSPLSARRGFFGSKPFSKTNDILLKTNQTPIDWSK